MYLVVEGEPQGKARARTVRGKNGRVHSYTPQKTVDYEQEVKKAFYYADCYDDLWFNDEPLKATIIAYFGIPKSVSNKKKEQMDRDEIRPCKKPDADNIAKAILDGLNGLVYKDDKQIVELVVKKHYSNSPCVEVIIEEAETEYGH